MKRSPRPRKTAELPRSLHQQLNLYAIAAGAAGVGMFALAQPADAKIVYTRLTRLFHRTPTFILTSSTMEAMSSCSRTSPNLPATVAMRSNMRT